jgi:hypothetical protein
VVAEVRFDQGTFRLAVDHGVIDIGRGTADRPDVVLETDPRTLEELAFTDLTVAGAERAGILTVTGDAQLAGRLLDVFPVPGGA